MRYAGKRPWETPWEHLEHEEHAELAMLRWVIRSQVAVGALLIDIMERENIVATLDNLTAAVAQLGTDISAENDDVVAALKALTDQIAALQVGTITQDQIDALTTSVQAADAAAQATDTAAKNAVTPPAV